MSDAQNELAAGAIVRLYTSPITWQRGLHRMNARSGKRGDVVSLITATAVDTALAGAACPAAAAIPQTERDVLLAVYTQTDGDHWTHNDAWTGPVGTECTWYGITCDES